MKINIYSHKEVEEFYEKNPDDQSYWISIISPGFECPVKSNNKLVLVFDDVTPSTIKYDILYPYYKREREKRDLVLFDEKMAYDVLDFYNRCIVENLTDEINIHCWAGKSRSVAVAVALSLFNGYPETFYQVINSDKYKNGKLNDYVFKLINLTSIEFLKVL